MSKETVKASKPNLSFTRALSPGTLVIFGAKAPNEGVRSSEVVVKAHDSTPKSGKNAGKIIHVPERISGIVKTYLPEGVALDEAREAIKSLPKEAQGAARKEHAAALVAAAPAANKLMAAEMSFALKSGLFAASTSRQTKSGLQFNLVALKQNAASSAELVQRNAELEAKVETLMAKLNELTAEKREPELL